MEVIAEMNNGEIIQKGLEDFRNIQQHMLLAREENATKTFPQHRGQGVRRLSGKPLYRKL